MIYLESDITRECTRALPLYNGRNKHTFIKVIHEILAYTCTSLHPYTSLSRPGLLGKPSSIPPLDRLWKRPGRDMPRKRIDICAMGISEDVAINQGYPYRHWTITAPKPALGIEISCYT